MSLPSCQVLTLVVVVGVVVVPLALASAVTMMTIGVAVIVMGKRIVMATVMTSTRNGRRGVTTEVRVQCWCLH